MSEKKIHQYIISALFGIGLAAPLFSLTSPNTLNLLAEHAYGVLGSNPQSFASQPWVWTVMIVGFLSYFAIATILNLQETFGGKKDKKDENSIDFSENIKLKWAEFSKKSRKEKAAYLFSILWNGLVANAAIAIFFTSYSIMSMNHFFNAGTPTWLIFALGGTIGLATIWNSITFTASNFTHAAKRFFANKKEPTAPTEGEEKADKVGLRRGLVVSAILIMAIASASMQSIALANSNGLLASILLIGLPTLIIIPGLVGSFIYKKSLAQKNLSEKEKEIANQIAFNIMLYAVNAVLLHFVPTALPYALISSLLIQIAKPFFFGPHKEKHSKKKITSSLIAIAYFLGSMNFGFGFINFCLQNIANTSSVFLGAGIVAIIMMGSMEALYSNIYNETLIVKPFEEKEKAAATRIQSVFRSIQWRRRTAERLTLSTEFQRLAQLADIEQPTAAAIAPEAEEVAPARAAAVYFVEGILSQGIKAQRATSPAKVWDIPSA